MVWSDLEYLLSLPIETLNSMLYWRRVGRFSPNLVTRVLQIKQSEIGKLLYN